MTFPLAVGLSLVAAGLLLLPARPASAGAILKINDDSEINLGFRLQTQWYSTQKDLDGDGSYEQFNDFKIRRGRIRLGADVTKWVSMFLQTEFSEGAGSGGDVRLIDGFLKVKPHKLANLIVGMNMAPSSRQALTSSGGLMGIDRPGLVYKALTWGTRYRSAFTNTNYDDGDAGLKGAVDVRDMGATLFGSSSFTEQAHFKYYLGIYDGIQNAEEDKPRIAGRAQFNFFDAEGGYYGLSTYLGKKKTVGIGASFDTQADVDVDASGDNIDYRFYSVDLFADYPVGPGTATFEAAYEMLDLDDFNEAAEGKGFYAQTGYFINNWQPWLGYETWDSDDSDDVGSFDTWKLGVSYFLKGHNANIKAGYEQFKSKENIGSSEEDTVGTFLVGLYVTY
jgi:hypothetical protein